MINVYGLEAPLTRVRAQLADTLHGCLVDVLGMPRGKRAQRFFPMAPENFYYPEGRSEAYTLVTIHMMSGRSIETRKQLIRRIYERVEQEVGISPVDLEIELIESPPENWGFRGLHGDEAVLDYNVKI
jgi:phenylpyruvate tautomerase PptA (4-oxalocrotonate tautomerase family)